MPKWMLAPCALALVWSGVTSTKLVAEPNDLQNRLAEANRAATENDSQRSVAIVTELLESNPDLAAGYYLRGRERFRSGDIQGSCEDFDRLIELEPDRKPQLWERGISCYYAGRYQDGVEQFSVYQTFDDNDVENAVWHFLCFAKLHGVKKSQQSIIRVRRDPRVPMAEVYRLFAGQATPQEVLAAANALQDPARQNVGLFYAHLYLGLYYDVSGSSDLARQHIETAVAHRINHYMWDVARVHANRQKRQ